MPWRSKYLFLKFIKKPNVPFDYNQAGTGPEDDQGQTEGVRLFQIAGTCAILCPHQGVHLHCQEKRGKRTGEYSTGVLEKTVYPFNG